MLSPTGDAPARQTEVDQTTSILVVDDDELIRTLLVQVLEEEGYQVTEAEDGRAAMSRLANEKFSLIVTDIVMPKMDGVELIKAAQRLAFDVPVIVITGYPSVDGISELVSMGVIDYITKPFDAALIRVTVAKVLEMQRVAKIKAKFQLTNEVAAIDPLTGVYNWTAFGHLLDAEVERSKWRNRHCTLVLGSVDDLGSLGIEEAVKAMEQSLYSVSMYKRPGDTVGRIGDSEFGVVLAEAGSEEAVKFSQRVMGRADGFTISAGVASFPEHGESADDLISLARQALAESRRRGGNSVSVPLQRPGLNGHS